MIKEIKYNGFTANPSDYECPDGDLAMSVGLVPEDGALKPVLPPKIIADFGNVFHVFIHKNNFTHYIVIQYADDNSLAFKWADATELQLSTDAFLTIPSDETFTDIAAIGNIVVISTSSYLYYFFWKDNEYIFLGHEIPDISLRFYLSGHLVSKTHTTNLTFKDYSSGEDTWNNVFTDIFDTANYKAYGTAGSKYSDEVKLPGDIALAANTEYRFSIERPTGFGCDFINVYGTSGSGEIGKLIVQASIDEAPPVINAGSGFTNLYFTAWVTPGNYSVNKPVKLTIQKGFKSTVSGKVIEYNKDNYNAVAGAVNKFVNKQATLKNQFIFPFFVRYAIKLYDGSYVKISPPILMIPNSGYVPLVNFKAGSNELNLYAVTADLEYLYCNDAPIDKKWEDIITGVDIFVSQQIFPYEQSKEYDDNNNNFEYKVLNASIDQFTGLSYSYCDFKNISATTAYGYQKWDIFDLAKEFHNFGDTSSQSDWFLVQLAPVGQHKVIADLRKVSSFYLFHSIDFNELTSPPESVLGYDIQQPKIDNGLLASLITRPTLPDDHNTSCTYFDARMFVYNQRLNLFSFKMKNAKPISPCFQNGHVSRYSQYGKVVRTYVYIRTFDGIRIANVDYSPELNDYENSLPWFFYPDNNAYEAVIICKTDYPSTAYYKTTISLKQHDMLNGACWMSSSLDNYSLNFIQISEEDANDVYANDIEYVNASVYGSPVNNPFCFPAEYSVGINCQNIFALSSAVRALSQGQFGQFPLYAFTSEGVWAIEISNTGAFSARQPITRDVCINPDSITQIDSAVLFATDRGIMLISGSETVCLSESINNCDLFPLSDLPAADKLVGAFNQFAGEQERITLENVSLLPFREFLYGCRMIYDYTGQRILVYNPSVSYAYVYSLKSKSWGMIHSDITDNVNAYPDALAMVSGNRLANFSLSDAEEITSLVVTRPFKLGLPDVLKTIDTIIQRGYFQRNHVCQVLYGSRNLFDWHIIWSSTDKYLRGFRGLPYKYFRLALICKLDKAESVYGCSVQFTPRLTNKPR